MAIRIRQLTLADQVKFQMLSKDDQKTIENCKSLDEASVLLKKMKQSVILNNTISHYEPKIQESGSSIKYKTKNLFTEIFEENDVVFFMKLVQMAIKNETEKEIINGELKHKILEMQRNGKQPLQCLVYSTKKSEKVFYNNENNVRIWAGVIADTVNENPEYAISINHMLVNWGMWKYQIRMLINACNFINQNEELDKVIRDLYIDYDDDQVTYAVFKRLLYSGKAINYKYVFTMLKKRDFISNEIDRKYFGQLKSKVEKSTREVHDALYKAFRDTQGLSKAKANRISSLFVERQEIDIIKRINESSPTQQESILQMVRNRINGTQSDYREIASHSKEIRKYRTEIQRMFMDKLERTKFLYSEIKICGLAIGDLDQGTRAIPFLKEQMNCYTYENEKQLMFAYVLAVLSDSYIDIYIDKVLKYDGRIASNVLPEIRNLGPGKNQLIRQYLYPSCLKIKDEKGINSRDFQNALRNIGFFIQRGNTVAIYDVKFDQMFFDFIGYDMTNQTFDKTRCIERNVKLVLDILKNVMDKNNYEGRYMKFMWDLFAYFRNNNMELSTRIDNMVKQLTGTGIPAM